MQHLDEATLQAWLDGARSGLDPSKLARIDRHVAACPACAARAEALTRSSFRAHALLAVGRDQYAPRVSYEDVAKRAHGSRAPERSRRIPVTWAASVVAAVAVGWLSNELAPNTSFADAAPAAPGEAEGLMVRGLVEDEGGRPVPSAQVFVAALDVGVLTQPDGSYDLRLPAEPDSFELTVHRIGFRQQVRAISGGEGDHVDADFRLREEALTLDEIVVTGESDGVPRRSGGTSVSSPRATAFAWRPLSSIVAAGYVGSDLWMLPGLDVVALEVAYGDNPNETHVARVRQDLGDGTTLTLIQGRTDGRRTLWPLRSEGALLSTRRGEMLITATAPVSTDSLRTLLTQLR